MLHADPEPLGGALKLELESCPVVPFHPEKLSCVPAFGLATTNSVVEFDAFHQVLFEELRVFSKLFQSDPVR
jgi:hypothetical protein